MEKEEENLDKAFILNAFKKLGKKYGLNEAFEDVVKYCAYSLANQVEMNNDREKECVKIKEKYEKNDKLLISKILIALMLEYKNAKEPIDILGDVYEDLGLIKKEAAQFFTPMKLCNMMSRTVVNSEINKKSMEEKGYISVLDPACGSGRNLYAVYHELRDSGIDNNNILLVGEDLDITCCCMTYIQLSLMEASAIVRHQNTLTMNIYDTFYTFYYALNKDLQNKIGNDNTKGDEIEV